MNEITRVQLGRQAFTIAVDAHKALQAYLREIEAAVGDKGNEVVTEVEMRMAELLAEHGVVGEKVILLADVHFLKEQLGDPRDFKDDDSDTIPAPVPVDGTAPKRLFRDTEHGMAAGVSAGIANYFGVDVLLVRILFLITMFAAGWGFLLYLALWLLVPAAKTSSEQLQMHGQAVTIDSLKKTVEQADLSGTASHARHTLVCWLNKAFKIILKIAGVIVTISALCVTLGLMGVGAFMAAHDGNLFQEGFFPVGPSEHILVVLSLVWVWLASLFVALIGIAMVRRKWPVANWATGVIVGLLFVGFAAIIGLAGDAAPKVRARFEAAHHSVTRTVPAFKNVASVGSYYIRTEHSSTYSVTLHYIGQPDISGITTTVSGDTLNVDTTHFKHRQNCDLICIFPEYNMEIVVSSPNVPAAISDNGDPVTPDHNGTKMDGSYDPAFQAPSMPEAPQLR